MIAQLHLHPVSPNRRTLMFLLRNGKLMMKEDEAGNLPSRQTAASKCAARWASLFPELLKAYKEGYKQAPAFDSTTSRVLQSMPWLFFVPCFDAPSYVSFDTKRARPRSAREIDDNLHYICRVSIHSIAKWAEADLEQEVPASFKRRINDALSVFGRILLSLKKQLREQHGIQNNDCPGCRYVSHAKTVALDGNFQLRRFAHIKDVDGVEFEGEDEVNTIWVNETDLIPYNESAKDGCASFSALEKQGGSTKGLDQTGAFACTCGHHGYPIAIVDMPSKGERLVYC
ncbi:hypothetical protein BDB00DRAFT_869313 [Zychaea mexicana]|uniref:uncharacterized protein n=1 Tax=Zychaea mexicana TaxID=64656 RepID=UPI0022FE40B5|nr:uncharacterized protein BDB00DRAFT_869313 [Zychaea mexicana]KAI9496367.1 hypothetical protein BDB00DRAFT_869313 [Zychaea mexicana]